MEVCASVAEDERYMVGESEHVDRLRDCDIQRLGVLIGDSAAGLGGDWRTLAARLGVDNSDVRNIEAMRLVNAAAPGEHVLRLWRRRQHSTIRVLREVLRDMKRDDVVRQLDYMRLSTHTLT